MKYTNLEIIAEVEKISGMKFNKAETWEEFEEINCVGLNIKAGDKLKIVHETKKPLHLEVRIIGGKTGIHLIENQSMKCLEIVKRLDKKNRKVYFKGELGGYYDGEQFFDEEPEGQNYVIHTKATEDEDIIAEGQKIMSEFKALEHLSGVSGEDLEYSGLNMARHLAYLRFRYLHGSEKLSRDEWQLLEESMKGGHSWKSEETFVDCYQYDINSQYASTLQDENFKFPMKAGKYITLKKTKHIHDYFGVFQLNLKKYDKRLFRETKSGFYTTYDVMMLDAIKAEYKLVKDDDNAFVYDKDSLISGRTIFNYLNDVYAEKLKGHKTITRDINTKTWGLLSQEKENRIPVEEANEKNGYRIREVNLLEGYCIIEDYDEAHPCRFTTARLKAFILAYSKYKFIGQTIFNILQQKKTIYKIKTDAVITNMKPEETTKIHNISQKLGDLKIEKHYEGKWKCQNLVKTIMVEN